MQTHFNAFFLSLRILKLMLHIRTRLYPWVERGILMAKCLREDNAQVWLNCKRLIFVCSGNICRSPYAEVVARDFGLSAISCGINTQTGLAADPTAILEAARRGRDIGPHKTTRWEDVQIFDNDIIIAMQLRHAVAVLSRAKAKNCRVVMLSSLLPTFSVAWDPYGKPQEQYAYVFDLIDAGVKSLAQRMGVDGRRRSTGYNI